MNTNTFKTFWDELTPAEKVKLAADYGSSTSFLSQIANGHRGAGVRTIGKLMAADKRISYEMFFGEAA